MTYAEYIAKVLEANGSEAKRRQHLEDDLQESVCVCLAWALPEDAVFWHPPNGGKRHGREGARLSRLGVKAGIADLHIGYQGRLYCIELKAPTGTLLAVQRQMRVKFAKCGIPTMVCRTPAEVRLVLTDWGIPLDPKVTWPDR